MRARTLKGSSDLAWRHRDENGGETARGPVTAGEGPNIGDCGCVAEGRGRAEALTVRICRAHPFCSSVGGTHAKGAIEGQRNQCVLPQVRLQDLYYQPASQRPRVSV